MSFQMFLQIAWQGGCEVTLTAFNWLFSAMNVHMCFQAECMVGFIVTFIWLFPAVSFQVRPQIACKKRLQNCSSCTCLIFLQCATLNVSSTHLGQSRQIHTWCICLTCLHCGFSNVSSNCLPRRMHSYTGCICLPFLHRVFSNVSQWLSFFDFSPLCVLKCVLKWFAWEKT